MRAADDERVAVVVPVRDDPRLERCLAALAAQTRPADLVVVVDDGSREPVRGRAGLRVVRTPGLGSYAARNAGVAAVAAEPDPAGVVAFTDADCLPDPHWLERGVAALAGADRVAGPVEVFGRRARLSALELYDARTGFPQEHFVRAWGFGATANLLVRRSVLLAVGPFDARLRSGGDADWGQRATAAGTTLRYAPDVVVRHPARATLRELVEKAVRTARGVEDLGRVRSEVTPLPEAVRRHLVAPVGRLRDAGELAPWDAVRFTGVAAVAAGLGAGEVLRGRLAGRLRPATSGAGEAVA